MGNDFTRRKYRKLIVDYKTEYSVYIAEKQIRQRCTLNSIFNYLRLDRGPSVEYSFGGLSHRKYFGKVIKAIRESNPCFDDRIDPNESMKGRVYRQMVAEIEDKYTDEFSILKREFSQRYGF
jgi:hypothetical protein